MRIGRRHIRCATSRVIVQMRRPRITMKRSKTFLLLSTHTFILSHITVLVLFWSPVLIHLICPHTVLLETLQTSHSATSRMRPNPTPPFHSLTRLSPLLWPTSTVTKARQLSFPLSCTTLHRCSIHPVLILALSSETRSMVVSSSADSAVTQTGYPPYGQISGSPSSSTVHPHIHPQVISDYDARITSRTTTTHAQDDTLSPNIPFPVPIVTSRHPSESSPSSPDTAANILRPGDSQ